MSIRDRSTTSLDATYLAWGWFIYSFSPTVPLLAVEQDVSRAVAGLHGTAMAVGTLAAAALSEPLVRRSGRKGQIVVGAVAIGIGVIGLIIGPGLWATLLAAGFAAVGGNLAIAAASPALLEHHGAHGPAEISKANAWATGVGLLAPLALGASVAAGWGWRPALAVTLIALAAVLVLLSGVPATGPLGRPAPPSSSTVARLPLRYWLLWIALVAGVSIEFATVYWASDLIRAQTGATAAVATSAVAALLAGMTISRFAISALARRISPAHLLVAGHVIAVAGWFVLWTASTPTMAAVGLLIAGLGYGTHYPLAVSLAVQSAGSAPDRGSARVLIGVGVANAGVPFLLGALADAFGPHAAFTVVPVLALIALGALAGVLRSSAISSPPEPTTSA